MLYEDEAHFLCSVHVVPTLQPPNTEALTLRHLMNAALVCSLLCVLYPMGSQATGFVHNSQTWMNRGLIGLLDEFCPRAPSQDILTLRAVTTAHGDSSQFPCMQTLFLLLCHPKVQANLLNFKQTH